MDYYSKYLKYKRKYLQLKMKLVSKTLNIDDTTIYGGSNIFIPNESNLGLPDVLPNTSISSNNLTEFDNYLKGGKESELPDDIVLSGGDSCGSSDKDKIIGGDNCDGKKKNTIGGDNYKTPTDTPLTIVELNYSENTPNYTPVTTTELSMEGGNKNNITSPSSSEIFESISKTE